jgi:hypothetical protein
MSKKAWQAEKTRSTERFFKAKKYLIKIEAHETLASSEENLTGKNLLHVQKRLKMNEEKN